MAKILFKRFLENSKPVLKYKMFRRENSRVLIILNTKYFLEFNFKFSSNSFEM